MAKATAGPVRAGCFGRIRRDLVFGPSERQKAEGEWRIEARSFAALRMANTATAGRDKSHPYEQQGDGASPSPLSTALIG